MESKCALNGLSQTYKRTESLARIGRTDYDSLSSCWSQKVIPSLTSYRHLLSFQVWTRLISTLISSSTTSRVEMSTMSMSSSTSNWSFCFLPYTSGADLSRHGILINYPQINQQCRTNKHIICLSEYWVPAWGNCPPVD